MTLLRAEKESELTRLLRGDAHNYIELALTYSAAGCMRMLCIFCRRHPSQ